MAALLDDTLLSQLADLAGSREPEVFLTRAHALLSVIVPHRTAVAWCGMKICVLGEEAELRRTRARQTLRAHLDQAGSGAAYTERTLTYATDSLLTSVALLTALREPLPERTQLRALDRLPDTT